MGRWWGGAPPVRQRRCRSRLRAGCPGGCCPGGTPAWCPGGWARRGPPAHAAPFVATSASPCAPGARHPAQSARALSRRVVRGVSDDTPWLTCENRISAQAGLTALVDPRSFLVVRRYRHTGGSGAGHGATGATGAGQHDGSAPQRFLRTPQWQYPGRRLAPTRMARTGPNGARSPIPIATTH